MKEYYNVFESGYGVLGFAASGLIMVAIGITVILFMKKSGVKHSRIIFMYFWTGFGILWTTIAFIGTGSEYISCIRAMNNGTYKEVEGLVENFDPMPYSGHKEESFTVNGILFKYSDFGPSAGFNNTKSHGGPIDEGKYLQYYDYVKKSNLFDVYNKNVKRNSKGHIIESIEEYCNRKGENNTEGLTPTFFKEFKEFVPLLATSMKYAVESAGWFWKNKKLNKYADLDDIAKVSAAINHPSLLKESKIDTSRINGFQKRQKYYLLMKEIFDYENCH